ncbi:hypothetical protein Pan54_47990 [Rubinisphaera italica]|uniref:Lipoprotein n=1 Tax=Rubinisphaera italica TaxID=2527969 RepID=A0A5C5XN77_9PLAN|nr:hypothetical protein Pan54_47990 [Rubinisphaera italica]
MNRLRWISVCGLLVSAMIAGCHTSRGCGGSCSSGNCPLPGGTVTPHGGTSYGAPQGSGTYSQPASPPSMIQGSGSR